VVQGPVGRTIYRGGFVSMNVSAAGGGLKYQWRLNSSALSGATTTSYVINSAATSNAGSYTVLITNVYGSVTTAPASVVVISPSAATYEGLILADGPEAWWRLDETYGTNMFDALGRGYRQRRQQPLSDFLRDELRGRPVLACPQHLQLHH
jgi:hypothetical protein